MKLRYFVLDQNGQLRKASQAAVQALWEGRLQVDALGCARKHEVHLVSVVCTSRLLPRKVYLLRLPLEEGSFTEESYLVLQAFTRPDCVTRQEAIAHHTEGWPPNLFQQLAVALDISVASLSVPLAIGGPLLLASALEVTPRQALRRLR
ncbi:MAG TPA: hypothetical protein VKU02_28350 [Gemmataceae bacterium]|nr:hypothetical protein [Gemmataceae bacterium]